MFVCYDKDQVVVAVSDHPITIIGHVNASLSASENEIIELVGKRIKAAKKNSDQLRVAVICNWNMPCGISTYTKYLVESLTPKVKEVRIFSEVGEPLSPDGPNVTRCWERGKSMRPTINKVLEWKPDFVIVQHEYGIFPNARFFLQMLQDLENIPYVVAMHSVYEHLDKTVCSSAVRNMIVHSEQGKETLFKHGHKNNVFVIPHGCIKNEDSEELWNIFQTPYAMVQFGFGFFYKGVDRALDAIHHLKSTQEKFKDIFYCYLCAENPHNTTIHDQYFKFLMDKARGLGIEDNITIVRGYQTEQIINNYLRTAKLAIFPYVNNPMNMVYGASGAIRIAMSNKVPVIASESHLFDDLDNVLPRPKDHLELAKEIDKVFSNWQYREEILQKVDNHIKTYTWDYTSNKYLDCYHAI